MPNPPRSPATSCRWSAPAAPLHAETPASVCSRFPSNTGAKSNDRVIDAFTEATSTFIANRMNQILSSEPRGYRFDQRGRGGMNEFVGRGDGDGARLRFAGRTLSARIARCHFPRARGHDDAFGSLEGGECALQGGDDFILALLGERAGLTIDLPRRPDGELEGHRIVQ